MNKILILSNHHSYTYNFRKEIIQELIENNYKVTIVLPYGDKVEKLKEMGCEIIDLPLDRRGINPLTDLKLLFNYYKVIKKEKPNAVMSYTIKPNAYGGIVCRFLKVPFFPNITGLGTAMENEGILQKILIMLYSIAFKRATCVFFQNEENRRFFIKKDIAPGRHQLIPGSGVNLDEFPLLEYPNSSIIKFVFVSRIMKEKGIDQYLKAAEFIKKKYPNTEFHICGFCEEAYEDQLEELQRRNVIIYHGMVNEITDVLKEMHCTIHPTYYPEGMSNVLLESAACGRAIITTDRSGCREIVNDGVNGFIVESENEADLIETIERFLRLPHGDKMTFGLMGREKVEKEFDRRIVVKAYLEKIKKVNYLGL